MTRRQNENCCRVLCIVIMLQHYSSYIDLCRRDLSRCGNTDYLSLHEHCRSQLPSHEHNNGSTPPLSSNSYRLPRCPRSNRPRAGPSSQLVPLRFLLPRLCHTVTRLIAQLLKLYLFPEQDAHLARKSVQVAVRIERGYERDNE